MKLEVLKNKKLSLGDFERLFKKYYQELCLYATSIVKSSDIAEEIVQDLFVKLWTKRDTIEFKKEPKSYLIRAVKNNCFLYERKNGRYTNVDLNEIQGAYRTNAGIEESLSVQEIQVIIDKTLETLPPRWQEIFRLIRFEGLKYREAAEKLDISIKTVEKAMGKTLKLFRANLTEYVN
jgi:RNA polymerase sigma-70 factor (ECF subfamily)